MPSSVQIRVAALRLAREAVNSPPGATTERVVRQVADVIADLLAEREERPSRDQLAALAMQGLCCDPDFGTNRAAGVTYGQTVARTAYDVADAMLAARRVEEPEPAGDDDAARCRDALERILAEPMPSSPAALGAFVAWAHQLAGEALRWPTLQPTTTTAEGA